MKMYAKLSRNLFDMSKVTGFLDSGSLNHTTSGFERLSDRSIIIRYGLYGNGRYLDKAVHIKAGTYTISCKAKSLTGSGQEGVIRFFSVTEKVYYRGKDAVVFQTEETLMSNTIEIPEGDYVLNIQPSGNASNFGNVPIQVSDIMLNEGEKVLPYEPYMENPIQPIKFLYKSRQLFDRSLPKFSGWAYIDNFTDNTITVIERQNVSSTTTWRSINIPIYGLEEGDTITLSGEWVNSSNNKGAVMVRYFEPTSLGVGKICAELTKSGGVATGVVIAKPTETAQLCVALYINTNGTLAQYDTVTYKNVMVCKGDKALPYEPYMPLTKIKAFYKSRNLFDIRKITGLKNAYGTSFNNHLIVSGDELTVKYGAYGYVLYLVGNERYLKVGDYTMSCLAKNNEDFSTTAKLALRNEELGNIESPRRTVAAGEEIELTYTFSITQEGIYCFSLQPDGNASKYKNLNFVFSKIMFNKGSTALPYEPPQEYPN